MTRLTSYRQGDRSEHYARTILSALGLAVPVPREEDVGIDFYCTLGHEDGNVTRFFDPYNMQVKSSSEHSFVYGGTSASGDWKIHEIAWILSQRTPFFFGLVDRSAGRMDLFCTITRWFAYHSGQVPYQLVFEAYTPASDADLHIGNKTPMDVNVPAGVEAVSWRLPLGQPVLSITVNQAEDRTFVASARQILRQYMDLDTQNAVHAANRMHYFHWPLRINTNQPLTLGGEWAQWYLHETTFTYMQLRTLTPLVATLLRTYEAINDGDRVTRLGGLLDLLPQDPDLRLVRQMIEDGIRMQAAKGSTSNREGVA